ncbi:NAD(P)H-binding protein [Mucilaginibacter sp. ZT4R22]|uniref:NAD(P)H-binding protein n=1 Tax=Mucilaginibacter pankratovii TaxID=2772110 RepID=A0ABR7WL81_9SPHI|nr:NAD(P)H-binding protein [Mucilaginibacter pankratovii]MBD1362868.1 NAD(P)H-binding protein [Mucilaginibacter pankratovii]
MRILILGATGRTGKILLQEAIAQGYEVNVLLRDKSKLNISHPTLRVFEGLPTDKPLLAAAMAGCEAILSALNISRTSDFPWAKLRTPANFLSETAECIIELAPLHNINRVILTSAWGTRDTREDIPWWFKWIIDNSNVGMAYRDHERQEELFSASTLNYTILRPAGLINSTKSKTVIVSLNNQPKPHLTISRSNVAKFMVHVLQDDLLLRQMPVISV